MSQKDIEKRQKLLLERWAALGPGQCFFVPCQDPITAEKKVREVGYILFKGAPIVEIGILNGMCGLLCYRAVMRGRQRTM